MQATNQATAFTLPASTSGLALRTGAQPQNVPTQFAIAMMKYQQDYQFMAAITKNLACLSLSPTNEALSPSVIQLRHHSKLRPKSYRKSRHTKRSQHISATNENTVAKDIIVKDGTEEEICTEKLVLAKDPLAASALAQRRQERGARRAHLKSASNARKTE